MAKAIQSSDLGINPSIEAKIIRLVLPPLSEERRKKLVALVKEKGEAAKISVRNVRRDANRSAEQSEKDSDLTEDDLRNLKDEIQEQTKDHETKIEEILKQKIDELMAV
jgi:ribosome recycling factor